MNEMKNVAIIVAGGKGRRMGRPKQFLRIAGKPMVEWTISAFQKCRKVDGIVLVVARENLKRARRLKFSKIIKVVAGGAERQDSVRNGLKVLPPSTEIVVIHDGARPLIEEVLIEKAVEAAERYGAVVVGVPIKDTIKEVIKSKFKVVRTLDRDKLWSAQTPQAFRTGIINKAYKSLRKVVTDDACAVENLKIPVKMIMGSYQNLKVTTPEDLKMAEAMLKRRKNR